MAKTKEATDITSSVDASTGIQFKHLAAQLDSVRAAKRALEKEEEELKAAVVELFVPLAVKYEDDKLQCHDWIITRTGTRNVRIDADLLLNRGVAPDVIAACTLESKSFSYRTKHVGQEE